MACACLKRVVVVAVGTRRSGGACGSEHKLRLLGSDERLARLEQRLEAAQDVAPAAGDVLGGLRCALEVVARGQLRQAALGLLELVRHPREALRGELGV